MTILDCCISLKMLKKFLVVLGVVDMRQLLLNQITSQNIFGIHEKLDEYINNDVFMVYLAKLHGFESCLLLLRDHP